MELEPTEPFEQAVLDTIRRRGLLAAGDRVVAAVSGGPDSLALLYALHALSGAMGVTLHVAHLNHRLRRAAPADARFVAETADRLGVSCTIEAVDVRAAQRESGLSLEHAARRERYGFFARVAAAEGAKRVATAHTADDTVETVLIHLLRGSGTDGLAGIPPCRPLGEGVDVVRPLIDTWRAEVEAYCRAQGLQPREDITNRSRAFLRNRVRLDLLPYLRRHFGEEVPPNLRRLAEIARPEVELLEDLAAGAAAEVSREVEGGVALSTQALGELPLALQRRVVRSLLREVSGSPLQVGFREIERVLVAAQQELRPPGGGAAFDLPRPVHVRREGDRVLLARPSQPEAPAGGEAPLPVPGEVAVPGGGTIEAEALAKPAGFAVPRVPRAREVYLDADAVEAPLQVRARRPGDRFTPLGMAGSKSLHDLFIDAKVPAAERARTPVVVDARGIVWVAGLAVAERAKVTPETRRLLRLRWSTTPHKENER